jgi:hypothetical protein
MHLLPEVAMAMNQPLHLVIQMLESTGQLLIWKLFAILAAVLYLLSSLREFQLLSEELLFSLGDFGLLLVFGILPPGSTPDIQKASSC